MSNMYDYSRFSSFIDSLIDRRISPIGISVATSTTYLKSLTDSSKASEAVSKVKADAASTSATNAKTSENNTENKLIEFTDLFAGLQNGDPSKTFRNRNFSEGAFYIRRSDGRLRYGSFEADVFVWKDATIKADRQSMIDIGKTLFLQLTLETAQTVTTAVRFNVGIDVPDITDWSTEKAANARSVSGLVVAGVAAEAVNRNNAISTAISTEVTNRNNAISTAISTEVTNRNNAISGAVSAEATARSNGDGIIKTALEAFANRFKRGSNSNGSWELRPGIIEMWGRNLGNARREQAVTFSFPLVLPNTSYNLSSTPIIGSANNLSDLWVQVVENARSESGMTVYYQSSTSNAQNLDGFDWRIICSVPFDYVAQEAPPGGGDTSGNPYGGGGGGGGGSQQPGVNYK